MQFKAKKLLNPTFRWLKLGAFAGTLPLTIALSATAQSDISGHWAEECISQLTKQGIVSGYPDGTFRPEATLTRAEYAAMLNQAFPNLEPEREAINFRDVAADDWGQEAIRTAYQTGFLSGYPGQEFRPDARINQIEAFVALARGLDYTIPDAPKPVLEMATTREEAFPEYAEGQLAAAIEQGILIKSPNKDFRGAATRSQVAAALCQVKNLSGVPEQYVVKPSKRAIALGQTCTNESIGYTVSYPNGWQTSSGNVVNQCQIFDAKAVELEEATEDFNEAIYFDLENIPFAELTSKGSQTSRQLSRRQTTVDGRQAVVEEVESTGIGLLPKGRRFYSYLIDFNDQTLVVRTYDVPSQPYQRNKQILDQMIEHLKFNQAAANQ